MAELDLERQAVLVEALRDPARYPHPADRIEIIETHISHVLLAGEHAYKIKKPLDLGFLDFSTLERRRRCCEEEVRLNRRLAPDFYLGVVAITGTPEAPVLGGAGEAIEHAVHMRRFPQERLLDRLLERGEVDAALVDRIARTAAAFHARVAVAGAEAPYGEPERVHFPVRQNFEQIAPLLGTDAERGQLERLRRWAEETYARLEPVLAARKRGGFVRECHGDMHLGNMALVDGELVIFDCIEFNDNLRWIDVVSEAAFFVMDMEAREQPALAARFLDTYLAHTGDYAGTAVLRYYQAYRAMVRAKVARIRLAQPGLDEREAAEARAQYAAYVGLAERYAAPPRPLLLLTAGVAGAGKTTGSEGLLAALGAVRLRSDVERKRLFGLPPEARTGSGADQGIYTPEAHRRTYARLLELAETVLEAGLPVIVDATFLLPEHRAPFRELARRRGVPFAILAFEAPEEVLAARVHERAAAGADASEAGVEVMRRQLGRWTPPAPEEADRVLRFGPGDGPETVARAVRDWLGGGR